MKISFYNYRRFPISAEKLTGSICLTDNQPPGPSIGTGRRGMKQASNTYRYANADSRPIPSTNNTYRYQYNRTNHSSKQGIIINIMNMNSKETYTIYITVRDSHRSVTEFMRERKQSILLLKLGLVCHSEMVKRIS